METLRRCLLLLAALNVALAEDKYVKNGGKLTLELRPTPAEPITNILWKFKGNLLAEWVKDLVPEGFYSTFKGRSKLDITTGRLTIDTMSKNDTGEYSVEVNNKVQSERYDVRVIEEVSKPVVEFKPLSCGPTSEQCKLICLVENPEAEPVTYSWKKDDGDWKEAGNELSITKAEDKSVKTFTCRATNPLGSKESEPQVNRIFQEEEQVDSSVDVGMVVGIVVGVIGFLAGLVFALWKLKKGPFKSKRVTTGANSAENGETHKDGPPSSPQPPPSPTDKSNNSVKSEEIPLKSDPEPKDEEANE